MLDKLLTGMLILVAFAIGYVLWQYTQIELAELEIEEAEYNLRQCQKVRDICNRDCQNCAWRVD